MHDVECIARCGCRLPAYRLRTAIRKLGFARLVGGFARADFVGLLAIVQFNRLRLTALLPIALTKQCQLIEGGAYCSLLPGCAFCQAVFLVLHLESENVLQRARSELIFK
ncbi:hypothetical protein PCAR4_830042 [Paraburkholderia caribensis]|nr:hypothetical protein PCAR4_830042 [Paraburkholderia caribensis]